MLSSLSLLSMKHEQAMRLMLQEQLKLGLSVDYLTTANPVSLPDGRMRVGVYLTEQAYQDPSWPFRGEAQFTYRRMDFADFFRGINLQLIVPAQCSTLMVVNQLERIFHIDIDDNDYVNEYIDRGEETIDYVLKATPTSQRWRGRVTIRLGPDPTPMGLGVTTLNDNEPGRLFELTANALDGMDLTQE